MCCMDNPRDFGKWLNREFIVRDCVFHQPTLVIVQQNMIIYKTLTLPSGPGDGVNLSGQQPFSVE